MSAARARATVRVAFYSRVGRDSDPGTTNQSLGHQNQRCIDALPPDAIIAVFHDVGSPGHPRSAPPGIGLGRVRRNSDLQALLDEALRQAAEPRLDLLTWLAVHGGRR